MKLTKITLLLLLLVGIQIQGNEKKLLNLIQKNNLRVGCIVGKTNIENLINEVKVDTIYLQSHNAQRRPNPFYDCNKVTIQKDIFQLSKSSLDFAYIDTNQILPETIQNLWPKVRPKGILCGTFATEDDLNTIKNTFKEEYSVKINDAFWSIQKPHFLSFIIPCYNRASVLTNAIASIYEQNITVPFEIVCTDDGSKDSTLRVLKQLQNKHSEVKHGWLKSHRFHLLFNSLLISNVFSDLLFVNLP